jgi:hypothetical protein
VFVCSGANIQPYFEPTTKKHLTPRKKNYRASRSAPSTTATTPATAAINRHRLPRLDALVNAVSSCASLTSQRSTCAVVSDRRASVNSCNEAACDNAARYAANSMLSSAALYRNPATSSLQSVRRSFSNTTDLPPNGVRKICAEDFEGKHSREAVAKIPMVAFRLIVLYVFDAWQCP